jgi:phosphoribosylanthranilate isomerase
MRPTAKARLKVCCIRSHDEAQLAIDAGAAAIGLVSRMPSGPGVIDDEQIAEIAARVPPGVDTFLLTCRQDPDAIVDHQRATGASTLQLVDHVDGADHRRVRAALPGIRLVQVVHVDGEASIERAERAALTADAVLLDSGNPELAVRQLGGTGRRHDWALSARIRKRLDVPIFLAGGLRAENAAEAVRTVRPFGLDVCSGLRDDAFALDPDKLARFAGAMTVAARRTAV